LLEKLNINREDLVRTLAREFVRSIQGVAEELVGEKVSIRTGHPELSRRLGPSLDFLDYAPPRDYGLANEVLREALNIYHLSSANHCDRVACGVIEIRSAMGLSVDRNLILAARYHDIGKIAIPLSILNKPGDLDSDQRKIMDLHQVIGYLILRGLRTFRQIADIMLFTHIEKGYPGEVVGQEVSPLSHIQIIADTFDGCLSFREYRKGARKSLNEVFQIVASDDKPRHPIDVLISTALSFGINLRDAKRILLDNAQNDNEKLKIEEALAV